MPADCFSALAMSALAVVLGTTTVTCGVELVRFRHAFGLSTTRQAVG